MDKPPKAPEHGIVTLGGLRELFDKRKRGERLPDEWIEQAKWYLKHKRYWVIINPDDSWNKAVLKEAEQLFRALLAW